MVKYDDVKFLVEQLKIDLEWGDKKSALSHLELIKQSINDCKVPQLQKYGTALLILLTF